MLAGCSGFVVGNGSGDMIGVGVAVTGMVPPGPVGVVVQPETMINETIASEAQNVAMMNDDLDIVVHPVFLVDSFRTCLIIGMMPFVQPDGSIVGGTR